MELAGSATETNLRKALAREAAVGHRLQWYAELADVEGQPEMAAAFRAIAERSKGNVFGVLEFLDDGGGDAVDNAVAAREGQHGSTSMYAEFATAAASEGFEDVSDWFESMAKSSSRSSDRLADPSSKDSDR